MKIFIFILCSLSSAVFGYSQSNLVPNPSLEQKDTLATLPLACVPKYWYSPNSIGSPDYVDSSFINLYAFAQFPLPWTTISNAYNYWGNYNYNNIMNDGMRLPHDGSAYIGISVATGREYIATELLDTLQAGKTYAFEFHTLLSNWSELGFDLFGAAFTQDRLINFSSNNSLQMVSGVYDAGGKTGQCLLDTVNWMTVRDTFIAEGGERFMTIGTPDMNNLTECRFMPSGGAYYFIDSFSLICLDCDTTTIPPRPTAPVIPADYTGIKITPNPIRDAFNLTYDLPTGGTFRIFDTTGRIVYSDQLEAGDIQRIFTLTEEIRTGIYVWSVSNGDETIIRGKIIVTR
jgi:Secretion system C-terminal sorting domain